MQDTDPTHPPASRTSPAGCAWPQTPGVGCVLRRAPARRLRLARAPCSRASRDAVARSAAPSSPRPAARRRRIHPAQPGRRARSHWLASPGNHVLTLARPRLSARCCAKSPIRRCCCMRWAASNCCPRPALAIVGSRNASTQGKANAHAFAARLQRRRPDHRVRAGAGHRRRRARRRAGRRRLDRGRDRHRRRRRLPGAQPPAGAPHRRRGLHRQRVPARARRCWPSTSRAATA